MDFWIAIGLHVIGVEPHDSRRIDRQLIGRAGRQGDPGSARFFVAADDALVQRFAPAVARQMAALDNVDGELTVDLSAEIEAAQRRAENAARAQRQALLAQDRWLDGVSMTLSDAG